MFRRPKPTIWSCLTVSVHHREQSSVRSQEGLIVLQQFHLKKTIVSITEIDKRHYLVGTT